MTQIRLGVDHAVGAKRAAPIGGNVRFANVKAGSLTVTDAEADEAPDRRFGAGHGAG
jgi:hypothetical protein